MTSIVTRTGKGLPLTISELDANFTNLNTDKVEKTRIVGAAAGELTVTNGGSLNQDIELGLPNSGVSAGTLNNSATQITPMTVDAKGRITGTSTPVTIAPQFASITSKPTTLSGYGITDGQPTITGAATTIDTEDLTASRALVSNSSGKVAVSGVSATELGYLANLGQNVQSQLDGKQSTAEKDAANGYAGLNSSGKLSDAVLPDLAISEYLGEVANETAMLALTGQEGDWCTRSDVGTIYIITGNPASTGGWMQLSYPGTPVKSVAGKTGVVTLDKNDVGLSALTNDAQLKIGSNLSDLNNAATARTNLGLGNVDNTSDATKNSATATLTNKTISGSNNTLSNIGNSSLTNSAITFGATSQALGSTVSALNAVSIGGTTAAAGNFTTLGATGNVTLGDANTDTLTINGTAVSAPNGLNVNSNQLVLSSGNLGIGTSSPVLGKLNVTTGFAATDTTARPVAFFSSTDSSVPGSSPSGLYIQYTGNSTATNRLVELFSSTLGSGSYGAMRLNNSISILSSGNVGIGTGTPGYKLDVAGTIRSNVSSNSYAFFVDNGTYSGGLIPSSATGGLILYNAVAQPLGFWTNNTERLCISGTGVVTVGSAISLDPTTANALVVNSSGNVGIGTSSPTTRLDVNGSFTCCGPSPQSSFTFNANGTGNIRTTSNWNFSTLNLVRNSANTATPRLLAFMLDGDSNSSTTIGGYPAIWGIYSGTPTTGSTSSALSAKMGLASYAGFNFYNNGTQVATLTAAGVFQLGSAISLDPTTANALVVNSSGNVGLNNANPATYATSGKVLNISGTAANNGPSTIFQPGTSSTPGAGWAATEVFAISGVSSATEITRVTCSGSNGFQAYIKITVTGHTSGLGNGINIKEYFWGGGTSGATQISTYTNGSAPTITMDNGTNNILIIKLTSGNGTSEFKGVMKVEWMLPIDFGSSTYTLS